MYLVLELLSVDGTTTSAGAGGIAGLDHEVGDDAMEYYVVIVAALGETCEVLARLLALVESYFKNAVTRQTFGAWSL